MFLRVKSARSVARARTTDSRLLLQRFIVQSNRDERDTPSAHSSVTQVKLCVS